MKQTHSLAAVPDDELLRRLGELVRESRNVEAELVAHIGEVDERRLFARFACSSMFAYCTRRLHLSDASAYHRIRVARAARLYPVLLEMLRDGRMHLSGLGMIVGLLTPLNCDTVLVRAVHRSKRELEELVAELQPRPDVPALMRKLPRRRSGSVPGLPPATEQAGVASDRTAWDGSAAAVTVILQGQDAGDSGPPLLGGGYGDLPLLGGPRDQRAPPC